MLRTPKAWHVAGQKTAEPWSRRKASWDERWNLPHTPKYEANLIIYTDGSCRKEGQSGVTTGAGVYRQEGSCPIQDQVGTGGPGVTNTITRAELIALLHALNRTRDADETIATDSLTSMHLIKGHLTDPQRYTFHKHRHLLEEITGRLVQRSRKGLHTTMLKVKSHIGIAGNEAADELANRAAAASHTPHTITGGTHPYQHLYWPMLKMKNTETGEEENRLCSNLNAQLK